MTSPRSYSRASERPGKLRFSTKFNQGVGAIPEALKTFAFNTFLLIYYNQVLGMQASLASAALTIAVVFDAIADPIIGSLSDGMRSRLGRRHPLMYASVLPLGITLFLLFSPPSGLTNTQLFLWLLGFAVASRVTMAMFHIPWSAMFAELSDDYVERSEIITYRYLVGGVGVVGFTAFVWANLFPSSRAFPMGQLDPAGYGRLAPLVALLVMAAALYSAVTTQKEVKFLLQPQQPRHFTFLGVLGDLIAALRNKDFTVLFIGLLMSATISGTLVTLGIYLSTYFWGLTPDDLRWFAFAGFGGLAAFAAIPWLNRRFDKKVLLIATMLIAIADGMVIITLRFVDVLPANGDPLLLKILVLNETWRAFIGVIIGVMFVSMVADTLDKQELETGMRQEGVFSAAIAFSDKAISGFGILAAGLLLDFVIKFPGGAKPVTLEAEVITRLGAIMGYFLPILYSVPLWLASRYSISRAAHRGILQALAARHNATASNQLDAPIKLAKDAPPA